MEDQKSNNDLCREVLLELLPKLYRQVSRDSADALRPYRMTPAQHAIVALLDTKGPLPPRRISSALQLDQSTVVSTLNRLERDGYISRYDDPEDGRSCLIKPTSAGSRIRESCEDAIDDLMKDFSVGLPKSDWTALKKLLDQLRKGQIRHADPS